MDPRWTHYAVDTVTPASLPHVAPTFCPECYAVGAVVILESGAYCRECPFDILAEDMPAWHAEALRRDRSGAVST